MRKVRSSHKVACIGVLVFTVFILSGFLLLYFLMFVQPGFEVRPTYKKFTKFIDSVPGLKVLHYEVGDGGDWDPYSVSYSIEVRKRLVVDLWVAGSSLTDPNLNTIVFSKIYSVARQSTNDLTNFISYYQRKFEITSVPEYNVLYSNSYGSVYDFFSNLDSLVAEKIIPIDLKSRSVEEIKRHYQGD